MKTTVQGEVLYGINTIYTVEAGELRLQCRIKGKVLRGKEPAYNPIAPGDQVEVIPDLLTSDEAMIARVLPRRSSLTRWNKKGRAIQVLAANLDVAVCVTSPKSPPFRPRFIDRLIVAAEAGKVRPVIVLNKVDLGVESSVEERLDHYGRMGYEVHTCSAETGEGIEDLKRLLGGFTSAFVGQSGVGKSSILNAIEPGLSLRVAQISAKHDRGNHTTNYSALLTLGDGLRVIDTPGVIELELADVLPDEVGFHFRDFAPFMQSCDFQPCLHDEEPGCAVRAAVESGQVHPDRYESYLRILQELREHRRTAHG